MPILPFLNALQKDEMTVANLHPNWFFLYKFLNPDKD